MRFDCTVLNRTDQIVEWIKWGGMDSAPQYLSIGNRLTMKDSRFELYDLNGETYSILIDDVQESDAGIYKCRIENLIEAMVRLTIISV